MPGECSGGVAHGWRHWLVRHRSGAWFPGTACSLVCAPPGGGLGVGVEGGLVLGLVGCGILLGPEKTSHTLWKREDSSKREDVSFSGGGVWVFGTGLHGDHTGSPFFWVGVWWLLVVWGWCVV